MGATAARYALPGDDVAGTRGARDRARAPGRIATPTVVGGADAGLAAVISPAGTARAYSAAWIRAYAMAAGAREPKPRSWRTT
jgi:hypothetical protein